MADNPEFLPQHKVIAFAKSVTMAPQQLKDPLQDFVNSDTQYSESGDRFTLDGMGLSDPVETYDDYGDTPANEPVSKRQRIGTFRTFEDDRPVGTREKAEQLTDPTNPTVMALRAGMQRRRTVTILKGLLGSAQQKNMETGAYSTVALPAGRKVGVSYNKLTAGVSDGAAAPGTPVKGLTVAKLRRAKILLAQGEYDNSLDDLPNVAVTEEDLQFLYTSAEFSQERHLINAVQRVLDEDTNIAMGFRFIRVKQSAFAKAGLDLTGEANGWRIPVWYKSAIHHKERPLNGTKIWMRAEKKFRWWAWYETQDSCVREYDEAVAEIAVTRDTA